MVSLNSCVKLVASELTVSVALLLKVNPPNSKSLAFVVVMLPEFGLLTPVVGQVPAKALSADKEVAIPLYSNRSSSSLPAAVVHDAVTTGVPAAVFSLKNRHT